MFSTLISVGLLALAAQTEGPIATSPSAPKAQPTAPSTVEAPVPVGAPADDFALVAWCRGALQGHMQLAQQIKDTLPLDPEMEAAGVEYLALYDGALAVAPQGRSPEGAQRAAEATAAGLALWDAARAAENRDTQKWTYLGWQLPGRCEHAANRLSKSDVMNAALKPQEPAPAQ